jgi:hypothetical protein
MPKAAPDQVIIHRIEFQETERELLRWAMGAYTFRNTTRGVFNLTSDVTTVVLLLVFLEMVTGRELLTEAVMSALGQGKDGLNSIALAVAEGFKAWFHSRESVGAAGDAYTQYAEGIEDFWDRLLASLRGAGESLQPGGGGGTF